MKNTQRKRYSSAIIRRLSLTLALMLVLANINVVSARAATPTITIKTEDTANAGLASQDKTVVSNLRIINLEQPGYGGLFDTTATVMSDEGISWDIPVVWVDETGAVAKTFQPGNQYTPVFSFYLPSNIIVKGSESGGFTIKLPEFLDKQISSSDLIMVADPAKNILFITTTSLVGNLTNNDQGSASQSLSFLVNAGAIADILTPPDTNAIAASASDESNNQESSDSSGSDDNYSNRWIAPIPFPAPAPVPQDNDPVDPIGPNQPKKPDQPKEPEQPAVVDLVKVHCSDSVIKKIGNDALTDLIDLIRNVIEPQAVSALINSFPSYAQAAEDGELGKNIGLYVFSHKSPSDPKRDDDSLAFVSGSYRENTTVYEYYIGVNIDTLLEESADGNYVIKEDALNQLKNTVTHEMMHAFMDDYVRTGMAGDSYVGSKYTSEENQFPNWFIEGSACTVDDIFTYRNSNFNLMRPGNEFDSTGDFTKDSILQYYNEKYTNQTPIQISDKTASNDTVSNELRDYVNGYMATLYLASLAVNHAAKQDVNNPEAQHEPLIIEDDNFKDYNNKAFLEGLDIILNKLHNGKSLDSIINEISDGRYTDTADFEKKFIVGEGEGNQGGSLAFCEDYLTYLNTVSNDLQKKNNDDTILANGSILLPLYTDERSAIKDKKDMPDLGEQTVYLIADSKDPVESTVSYDTTYLTAGTKGIGNLKPDEGGEQIAAAQAASFDSGIAANVTHTDPTPVETDAAASDLTSDENDTSACGSGSNETDPTEPVDTDVQASANTEEPNEEIPTRSASSEDNVTNDTNNAPESTAPANNGEIANADNNSKDEFVDSLDDVLSVDGSDITPPADDIQENTDAIQNADAENDGNKDSVASDEVGDNTDTYVPNEAGDNGNPDTSVDVDNNDDSTSPNDANDDNTPDVSDDVGGNKDNEIETPEEPSTTDEKTDITPEVPEYSPESP